MSKNGDEFDEFDYETEPPSLRTLERLAPKLTDPESPEADLPDSEPDYLDPNSIGPDSPDPDSLDPESLDPVFPEPVFSDRGVSDSGFSDEEFADSDLPDPGFPDPVFPEPAFPDDGFQVRPEDDFQAGYEAVDQTDDRSPFNEDRSSGFGVFIVIISVIAVAGFLAWFFLTDASEESSSVVDSGVPEDGALLPEAEPDEDLAEQLAAGDESLADYPFASPAEPAAPDSAAADVLVPENESPESGLLAPPATESPATDRPAAESVASASPGVSVGDTPDPQAVAAALPLVQEPPVGKADFGTLEEVRWCAYESKRLDYINAELQFNALNGVYQGRVAAYNERCPELNGTDADWQRSANEAASYDSVIRAEANQIRAQWAQDVVVPLTRDVQQELTRLDYYSGPVDGFVNGDTVAGIESFLAVNNLPPGDQPTYELLGYLKSQSSPQSPSPQSRMQTPSSPSSSESAPATSASGGFVGVTPEQRRAIEQACWSAKAESPEKNDECWAEQLDQLNR